LYLWNCVSVEVSPRLAELCFFVSRVDTLVDKKLEKIGSPEALDLRGKVSRLRLLFFLWRS
jgi:hypothetical protein